MINSALAQAIVNPNTPDLIGSFQQGQAQGKKMRVNALAGRAYSGDQTAFDELNQLDPEVGYAIGESIRASSAKDVEEYIRDARIGQGLLASNPDDFMRFGQQRVDSILARGGDPSETYAVMNMVASGDIQGAMNSLRAFTDAVDSSKLQGPTAEIRNRETLLADLNSDDPARSQSARIALGMEGRASNRLTPEQAAAVKRAESLASGEGKAISARQQGFIDNGVVAADATIITRRALALMDMVKTGGAASASLAAKRFFGVEGADEAELSNAMGKAVLSQLRATFGAAFTENEGKRLEVLEAGFGKSVEGNRRILEQALKLSERSARRGMSAAKKADDMFTFDEIKGSLDFDLSGDFDGLESVDTSVVADEIMPIPANAGGFKIISVE